MKCILLLNRKGKEEVEQRFDASDIEDGEIRSKVLIMEEWRDRQAEFPFTPEPPPDATLLCEVFSVTGEEVQKAKEQERSRT